MDHTPELRYELVDVEVNVSTQAGKTREVFFKVHGLGKIEAVAKDAVTGDVVPDVFLDIYNEYGYLYERDYEDENGLIYGIAFYGYPGDTALILCAKASDPAIDYLGYAIAEVEVMPERWKTITVDINLEPNKPGVVSGRVVDPQGNGVEGATVKLFYPDCYDDPDNTEIIGGIRYVVLKTVYTDDNGNYEFTDVIPNMDANIGMFLDYVIKAEKEGMGEALSNNFHISSGDSITIAPLTLSNLGDTPFWKHGSELKVIARGWSGVLLEWPKAGIAEGTVEGYRLYIDQTLVADISADDYSNMISVRYVVSGLEPCAQYTFAVEAYSINENDETKTSDLLVMEEPVNTLPAYNPNDKLIRASVSNDGIEGSIIWTSRYDKSSYISTPVISGDGRYVVFASNAENLCAKDLNENIDVFLFDRETGKIKCLSLNPIGNTANESSWPAAVSSDGRYVVIESYANDLIPGVDDNEEADVYLYDTVTGMLELISVAPDEKAAGFSYALRNCMSSDGRYVVFNSAAESLTGAEGNDSAGYVFVRDRVSATTVKIDPPTVDGTIPLFSNVSISDNGKIIVVNALFQARNDYLMYVYLYDMETGNYELVSRRHDDPETPVEGIDPAVSADGRYIAFESSDPNLVENDNNFCTDVFVYDRLLKKTMLVSVSSEGVQGDGESGIASISANGRYVVFTSEATNLVPDDNNYAYDVFLRDLIRGTTVRISHCHDGSENDGLDFIPMDHDISDDGRYIVYDSLSSNLVPHDGNNTYDIFVYDRGPETDPVTVPGTPLNLAAEPGDGQVKLTWSAPENNGGCEITHYEVSVNGMVMLVPANAGTTIVISGLTNDTEYTFKVRAINFIGAGAEAAVKAAPRADQPEPVDDTTPVPPVVTYTVTVINGTGSGAYEQGTVITITADPAPEGKRFKEWQVISGSVTLEDPYEPVTRFRMPAGVVEIAAVYEDIPVQTYTVTVNGSHAENSGAGRYAEGETVTIDAGSRPDHRFDGWTSDDGVIFADEASPVTNFVMPAADVTVTATWTYIDDGSGEEPGEDETGEEEPGEKEPDEEEQATYNAVVKTEDGTETSVPAAVDRENRAVTIEADFLEQVRGATNITVPGIPDVDSYSVSIPVTDLTKPGGGSSLTMHTEAGSITIPADMLAGLPALQGERAQITIGRADKSALPGEVSDKIGDRPVIQLTLSIDETRVEWNNPNAPVTVSILYTPTAEELANPESIVVWYIDGAGKVITVNNGRYDAATGTVTFTTTHFSNFAVAYNKVTFSDVPANAWYSKAVDFIAARGITTGTGGGKYSPDAKLTRGEFIVILMRAYGIASDTNPTDNFADAGNTYYTGYLAAAKRLGISRGVGNNMFEPNKAITRQEMFTLLYNALRVIGMLPEAKGGRLLSSFADADSIAPWAKDAMSYLAEAGIIKGSGDRLNPLATSTRAEMAQVIYNLLSR